MAAVYGQYAQHPAKSFTQKNSDPLLMRGLNKPETDSVIPVSIAFWKGPSMKDRKIPIVLVGFGTTTAAVNTYSFIGSRIKGAFPDHTIRWAYSSRMVRDFSRQRNNIDLKSPRQVLCDLAKEATRGRLCNRFTFSAGMNFIDLWKRFEVRRYGHRWGFRSFIVPGIMNG